MNGAVPARILFVDDESRVLDALRRSLRPRRSEWDAEFAASGQTALEMLAAAPFDVIVSDMRMPGMDGAALLAEVRRRHPQMVRMVLSGQSDLEYLIQSVGVAHQCLAKPCSIEELRSRINGALRLRQVLANPLLRDLLGKIDTLPSLPALYLEVVKLLNSPFASVKQIGDAIARDVGMCAKVLQIANSALLGRREPVCSPAEAVSFVGSNMLRSLILAEGVFRKISADPFPGFSVQALWDHSARTSVLARRIAEDLAPGNSELHFQAQAAGLLHDAGELVMACQFSGEYVHVLEQCHNLHIPLHESERLTFGASHADLGAHMMALWGLPDEIVEAVAYHHSPLPDSVRQVVVFAVHVSDALVLEDGPGGPIDQGAGLDQSYVESTGWADQLDRWRQFVAGLGHDTA